MDLLARHVVCSVTPLSFRVQLFIDELSSRPPRPTAETLSGGP